MGWLLGLTTQARIPPLLPPLACIPAPRDYKGYVRVFHGLLIICVGLSIPAASSTGDPPHYTEEACHSLTPGGSPDDMYADDTHTKYGDDSILTSSFIAGCNTAEQ